MKASILVSLGPGWPADGEGYRVARPGSLAGLAPLEPYTSEREIAAFVARLKRDGVHLSYRDGAWVLAWPGGKPSYRDLALVEVNWDALARRYGIRLEARATGDGAPEPASYSPRGSGLAPREAPPAPSALLELVASPFRKIELDPAAPVAALPQVIFDSETTGLTDPRAVEYAARREETGGTVSWEISLCNPERSCEEGARRKHGLTDEELARAPLFRDRAIRVREILSGAVFIAYHAAFDLGVLRTEFAISKTPWEPSAVVDPLALARRLWPGLTPYKPGVRPYSLENVVVTLGICDAPPHRARPDAEALRKLWGRILEKLPAGVTLGELSAGILSIPGVAAVHHGHRRQADGAREVWAAEALCRLEPDEADAEIAGSLAGQIQSGRGLTDRQWEAAIRIALKPKYRDQAGRPPAG